MCLSCQSLKLLVSVSLWSYWFLQVSNATGFYQSLKLVGFAGLRSYRFLTRQYAFLRFKQDYQYYDWHVCSILNCSSLCASTGQVLANIYTAITAKRKKKGGGSEASQAHAMMHEIEGRGRGKGWGRLCISCLSCLSYFCTRYCNYSLRNKSLSWKVEPQPKISD